MLLSGADTNSTTLPPLGFGTRTRAVDPLTRDPEAFPHDEGREIFVALKQKFTSVQRNAALLHALAGVTIFIMVVIFTVSAALYAAYSSAPGPVLLLLPTFAVTGMLMYGIGNRSQYLRRRERVIRLAISFIGIITALVYATMQTVVAASWCADGDASQADSLHPIRQDSITLDAECTAAFPVIVTGAVIGFVFVLDQILLFAFDFCLRVADNSYEVYARALMDKQPPEVSRDLDRHVYNHNHEKRPALTMYVPKPVSVPVYTDQTLGDYV